MTELLAYLGFLLALTGTFWVMLRSKTTAHNPGRCFKCGCYHGKEIDYAKLRFK